MLFVDRTFRLISEYLLRPDTLFFYTLLEHTFFMLPAFVFALDLYKRSSHMSFHSLPGQLIACSCVSFAGRCTSTVLLHLCNSESGKCCSPSFLTVSIPPVLLPQNVSLFLSLSCPWLSPFLLNSPFFFL